LCVAALRRRHRRCRRRSLLTPARGVCAGEQFMSAKDSAGRQAVVAAVNERLQQAHLDVTGGAIVSSPARLRVRAPRR
jgi:hypothetical protein